MTAKSPDWAELEHLADELAAHESAGTWNRAAFRDLFRRAELAAGDFREALEFLINAAEPGWLSDIEKSGNDSTA